MTEQKKIMGILRLESCGGCTQKLLNNPDLLQLLNNFELIDASIKEKMDYLLVEGCVINDEQKKSFLAAKERAGNIILFGSCAVQPETLFGINKYEEIETPYSIRLLGCSPSFEEMNSLFSKLLSGNENVLPSTLVCDDCAKNETKCLMLKGIDCDGSKTYGGCRILCPKIGKRCTMCRTKAGGER